MSVVAMADPAAAMKAPLIINKAVASSFLCIENPPPTYDETQRRSQFHRFVSFCAVCNDTGRPTASANGCEVHRDRLTALRCRRPISPIAVIGCGKTCLAMLSVD